MFKKVFHKFSAYINRNNSKTIISAVSYGTASIVTQALMMIYLLIIAKWLGAEGYGYIAASYAAISLSSFLFNWGFNQYIMKIGSTNSEPRALGGKVILTKCVLGVVWGILLFFVLRLVRPDLYLKYILILTILDILLDSLFGTLISILLIQKRANIGSILLIFSRLVRLLAIILVVFLCPKSIFLVLLIRFITSLIAFSIAWALTKPKITKFKFKNIRDLFFQSFEFNASELLDLIYLNLDVNILVWFGAEPKLIASYSIVISLLNALITLPSGIYNSLLPSLIQAFNHQKKKFKSNMLFLYSGFTVLAIAFWIGITFLSNPLITIYLGNSYFESVRILVLLAPILSIRSFNQANIAYLISVGWQSKRLFPQLATLMIKLGIGMCAVSQYQSQGMITVAITTEAILSLSYFNQIIHHYSLNRSLT